jgi:hypothetical protein
VAWCVSGPLWQVIPATYAVILVLFALILDLPRYGTLAFDGRQSAAAVAAKYPGDHKGDGAAGQMRLTRIFNREGTLAPARLVKRPGRLRLVSIERRLIDHLPATSLPDGTVTRRPSSAERYAA